MSNNYFIIFNLIIIFLTFLQNIYPQWEVEEIYGPERDVYNIQFFESGIGYAAGFDKIIKINTAGDLISETIFYDSVEIRSFHFADENNGWLCSFKGIILRTYDGGKSWIKQNMHTDYDLNAIYFADSLHGWAAGTSGVVLKTTDGGENWVYQAVDIPSEYGSYGKNIIDLKFVDQHIGYFCSKEFLYKTSNGGNNWESVFKKNGSPLVKISLPASNNVFVASEESILHSNNSWETWTASPILGNFGIKSTIFFNGTTGLVAGVNWEFYEGETNIWMTLDKGQTWIQSSIQEPVVGLYSLQFINQTTGYAGGETGNIYKTIDSGFNWIRIFPKEPLKPFNDIAFFNSNIGWIVGDSGLLLKTEDGGKNWNKNNFSNINTNDIEFINENKIWFSGNGIIYNTMDGGKNFNVSYQDSSKNFTKISFANENIGFVLAFDDYYYSDILKTTDGGQTWKTVWKYQGTYKESTPNSLSVISEDIIWATCYYGGLLHSEDGGNTWIKMFSGVSRLWDLYFKDNKNGIVIGGGEIIKTSDGGISWGSTYTLGNNLGIDFFTDSIGGISVQQGKLKITTDFGESWQDIKIVSNQFDLKSISFSTENTIWLIGNDGLLLKVFNSLITEVENNTPILQKFVLLQNYPNPFNPTTTIEYSIPKQSKVVIKVFDLLGREVATLVDEEKTAGNYKVAFNGSNLTSGIYFYRLDAGGFSETKKLILLR